MSEREPKFTPYSGTMKRDAEDVMEEMGVEREVGRSFNLWAAVKSLEHFKDKGGEFFNTYGVTKSQAKEAKRRMYGE